VEVLLVGSTQGCNFNLRQ